MALQNFFFPPPLERAAEKFLSESQILEARALVFSQVSSCQGEKSASKWCETLFWWVTCWTGCEKCPDQRIWGLFAETWNRAQVRCRDCGQKALLHWCDRKRSRQSHAKTWSLSCSPDVTARAPNCQLSRHLTWDNALMPRQVHTVSALRFQHTNVQLTAAPLYTCSRLSVTDKHRGWHGNWGRQYCVRRNRCRGGSRLCLSLATCLITLRGRNLVTPAGPRAQTAKHNKAALWN